MKAGLQGEHPFHHRALATTVQGRISRLCFAVTYFNQSRMRTYPITITCQALLWVQTSKLELSLCRMHVLMLLSTLICYVKHMCHFPPKTTSINSTPTAASACQDQLCSLTLLSSEKTPSSQLAVIVHPAGTEPTSALLGKSVPCQQRVLTVSPSSSEASTKQR